MSSYLEICRFTEFQTYLRSLCFSFHQIAMKLKSFFFRKDIIAKILSRRKESNYKIVYLKSSSHKKSYKTNESFYLWCNGNFRQFYFETVFFYGEFQGNKVFGWHYRFNFFTFHFHNRFSMIRIILFSFLAFSLGCLSLLYLAESFTLVHN